ncbi:MAG: 1-(5-phosphoribosyl)-5-[(5-phosphoribosylamino)methylideneamino]imidazole-4-carboxamide isomerase [Firmicutes bacterium]|nr:1-(5-phosphoribosyl)-5-[(5-phosphoribosylamino)methylideneamino]imidazole-4-carboxamide isomerase [Bacillota bacterium]
MLIFPAIDIFNGNAVRLFKGNYNEMTIYSHSPIDVANDMKSQGASCLHLVDLEGAAKGMSVNAKLICNIKKESDLFCEVGGGIRNLDTVSSYIENGIDRVILGSAAQKDPVFLKSAALKFGKKIAVGVDIKNGKVAIHGWKDTTDEDAFSFCDRLQDIGITTIICTDISRDGAMRGTNLELYRDLANAFSMNIIASGGVSSLDDILSLKDMNIYGAIIGKAYYTGDIVLKDALEAAK